MESKLRLISAVPFPFDFKAPYLGKNPATYRSLTMVTRRLIYVNSLSIS